MRFSVVPPKQNAGWCRAQDTRHIRRPRWRSSRTWRTSSRERNGLDLLTQHLLVELAHTGTWDLRDEAHVLHGRELPLGEVLRQMRDHLLRANRCGIGLAHGEDHRALVPLR